MQHRCSIIFIQFLQRINTLKKKLYRHSLVKNLLEKSESFCEQGRTIITVYFSRKECKQIIILLKCKEGKEEWSRKTCCRRRRNGDEVVFSLDLRDTTCTSLQYNQADRTQRLPPFCGMLGRPLGTWSFRSNDGL